MVILLGPNNHGKSNILSALEFALTPSSKPLLSDFNAFCGENHELWAEITFHELTDQEKITFKKYLRQDGTFCVRKTARLVDETKLEVSLNGYCQIPDTEWLKPSEIANLAKRGVIEQYPLKEYVPSAGRITQENVREAQRKYIEDHQGEISFHEALETTAFIGPANIGGGLLPDFFIVPAVRDLTEETRSKGTSTYYRMIGRAIREIAENDDNFCALREKVDELAKSLNRQNGVTDQRPSQLIDLEKAIEEELTDWKVGVDIQVIPPVFEKFFEFGTTLNIDDGVKTRAEEKGHGLQRALMFALFRAWAKSLRNISAAVTGGTVPRISSESVIYAIEEPELFLHPHAQKKMALAIKEIAQTPNHQIIICSHSSHFIDLDNYKSICLVNKPTPQRGTELRQCTQDLFSGTGVDERKRRFHAAQWINPDRGEMFFAKKVAFVEGETEKVIFPFLANKLNCYDPEVSIIECGSKFNLPLYVAIANAFKLHYVVVYDEDPLPIPTPPGYDRRAFETNSEIQTVINTNFGSSITVTPDFEGIAGVSRTQGTRKGKALAALEHFSSLDNSAIPQTIQDIVRNVYS